MKNTAVVSECISLMQGGEYGTRLLKLVDRLRPPAHFLNFDNAKTVKGEELGYRTGVLYLAPAKISGYNVCPSASAGCIASCLNTAGRGSFLTTQLARIRKTRLLFTDRATALSIIHSDIAGLVKFASKRGMIPAVRLNGTSDIPWHAKNWGAVPQRWSDVQFYGYTKRFGSWNTEPANVHTVYSLDERDLSKERAKIALANGVQVAAVFDSVPKLFWRYRVHDGDKHDLTFLQPPGILGLKAKGRARRDTSGFVQLMRKPAK